MKAEEEKAKELIDKFITMFPENYDKNGKSFFRDKHIECALICVENEYKALREQLFNLRACRVIEDEKVYLHRVQQLIDEEKEVKEHLNKMK